jgi:hypothetical protein
VTSGGYQIPDDPRPSRLSSLAVHPQWPLLSVMLAGAWLAWPWLVWNAFALGSATRWREVGFLAGGAAGSLLGALGLLWLVDAGWLTDAIAIRLGILAIVVYKVAMVYAAVGMQTRSHATYESSGGRVRSGIVVLGVGIVSRSFVLGAFDSLVWKIVAGSVEWSA